LSEKIAAETHFYGLLWQILSPTLSPETCFGPDSAVHPPHRVRPHTYIWWLRITQQTLNHYSNP